VFPLTEDVLQEISFWLGVARMEFTTPIWPVATAVSARLFSDAGRMGWGGWTMVQGVLREARGFLTLWEREQSSTLRELVAVRNVLESLRVFIAGTAVRLHVDSQSAWLILQSGSGVETLHSLALQVFWFCVRHGIRLVTVWIPRELNAQADYLAGIYDVDDWKLADFWFRLLSQRWGRHTIDRFATHLNNLCKRFNSRWWCPGCEDVDCLTLSNWAGENNWCNPPFGLIGRLLRVLWEQWAVATIIVPMWTGRYWWPLLCPDGVNFAGFVVDWVELPRGDPVGGDLFLPGAGRANEAHVGPPAFRVFAVRVDFRSDVRRRSVFF
jgi:hypothetical protein